MNRPQIIFDTDPGADDAIALLWLLALHAAGHIELHAVTTTSGNVDRRTVFANALRICALAGASALPVARGAACAGPHAAHIHGADGLAGHSDMLPAASREFATAPPAERVLVDTLDAHPGELTLLAVGPLTNLAAAERLRPGCLRRARRIVLMGGSLGAGNVTAHAEFNVYHNASAWRTVLNAALADVVTLDVTRNVWLAESDLPQPRAPSAAQRFFLAVAHSMASTTASRGTAPGFLLHDAVAVAAVCYPPLLGFRDAALDVVVDDTARHGKLLERAPAPPNARLATHADRRGLIATLLQDTFAAPTPP